MFVYLAIACPENKYGWDCKKQCHCQDHRHCHRFLGPTEQCKCKTGYFNPPKCEAGENLLLHNYIRIILYR